MANKIKPGGVVSDSPSGTTFTKGGTHAPTLRGSSTAPHNKIAVNGITSNSPQGTTFQGNKTDIKTPNADKAPAESKVKKSGAAKDFVPNGKGIKYGDGGNGPSVKNPSVKKR